MLGHGCELSTSLLFCLFATLGKRRCLKLPGFFFKVIQVNRADVLHISTISHQFCLEARKYDLFFKGPLASTLCIINRAMLFPDHFWECKSNILNK